MKQPNQFVKLAVTFHVVFNKLLKALGIHFFEFIKPSIKLLNQADDDIITDRCPVLGLVMGIDDPPL